MFDEEEKKGGILKPIIIGAVCGLIIFGAVYFIFFNKKEKKTEPVVTPTPGETIEEVVDNPTPEPTYNPPSTPKPPVNPTNPTAKPTAKPTATPTPRPTINPTPKPEVSVHFGANSLACEKGKPIQTNISVCYDIIDSVTSNNNNVSISQLGVVNIVDFSDTYLNNYYRCVSDDKCISQFQQKKCQVYDYLVSCKTTGTSELTAKTKSGKTDKIKVNIVNKFIDVKSITFGDVTNRVMKKGSTRTLSVTFNPTNTTNKNAMWYSSNPKILKVDQKGKVTAVAKGRAKITAEISSLDGVVHRDTVELIVYENEKDLKPNDLVYFHRLSGSCSVGKTKDVKIYTEALNNYKYGIDSVTSKDKSIATVSKSKVQYRCINCVNYTISCKKKGVTYIDVKSTAGGTATYKITVK